MKPFEALLVWRDPIARSGPECMAVDELILRDLGEVPVLRLYRWDGNWMSVGYFGDVKAAQERAGKQVSVVRRWTGGGVVDHRNDVTYSLMIPREHSVAQLRGAESYKIIHHAVVEALVARGIEAQLVEVDSAGSSEQCFEKPVAWDVVSATGEKLAGAGQRRTRWGLLHQGSVQVSERTKLMNQLEVTLCEKVQEWSPPASLLEEVSALALEKYA